MKGEPVVTIRISLLAAFLSIVLLPSNPAFGQTADPPQDLRPQPPSALVPVAPEQVPARNPGDESDLFDDVVAAGLPKGSHPHVLSLEQAYALALIRSRAPRPGPNGDLTAILNPTRFTQLSRQFDTANFARFRQDFLATQDRSGRSANAFRDPSGAFLSLTSRLMKVQLSLRMAESMERHVKLYESSIGGGSGVSPAQVDRLRLAWLKRVSNRQTPRCDIATRSTNSNSSWGCRQISR
jgi:hypothetical protein